MISKSEFDSWWHHPITEAFRAHMKVEMEACLEAAVTIDQPSLEHTAMKTIAYANKYEAFLDMATKSHVSTMLEVKEENDE